MHYGNIPGKLAHSIDPNIQSNLTSKIDQKFTKTGVKMHLIWDIVFGFVLGVILVPTWSQPDPKIVDFSLCFVYFLEKRPL